MNLSSLPGTSLDVELKTIVGRLVMLENLVTTVVMHSVPDQVRQELMEHLKTVKAGLVENLQLERPWKNDVLSIMEAGISPDGPRAAVRP